MSENKVDVIKVTFETKKGCFTESFYGFFGFKVGDKCFVKSPYHNRRGTYKIVAIETENK